MKPLHFQKINEPDSALGNTECAHLCNKERDILTLLYIRYNEATYTEIEGRAHIYNTIGGCAYPP